MNLLKVNGIYNIAQFDISLLSTISNVINKVFTIIVEDQCVSIIYDDKYNNSINYELNNLKIEEGWSLFKINTSMDFGCYGVLQSVICNMSCLLYTSPSPRDA